MIGINYSFKQVDAERFTAGGNGGIGVAVLHGHCPCSDAQHVEQVEHPGDVVFADFVSRITQTSQLLLQTINQFKQPLLVQSEFCLNRIADDAGKRRQYPQGSHDGTGGSNQQPH